MSELTRRQFMRRGALVAAGGFTAPLWMTWLSEQMEQLRPPRKHIVICRRPSFAERHDELFQAMKRLCELQNRQADRTVTAMIRGDYGSRPSFIIRVVA